MKYEPQLHVVLHEPEIPHNAGSVGRTCVAIAAKLWMIRPLGFRTDDYYLRRAGLDYWQHLEWDVVDGVEQLAGRLPDRPWLLFSKKADRLYTDVQYEVGDILVFGNESQGLPESMLEAAGSHALRIPTRSKVRSLNLSNAVAVVAYEAIRQWDTGALLT